MSYLAIARKWRPHRFEDLVGQSHVVQTLKNAILFNRVSHAYLFSGARGIGKTSVARIFAKTLRCPNAKDAVPCNECPECLAIAESRSVDVVEIDGASNNGVEAVRGIRDNVAYGASSGNYKIYIIDEVHMLSLSAFNALLKTLEEPPPHVIFIFATTEVQKIPLTILSRCQRFEFRRLTHQQVVDRLKFILQAEGITISEEGLRTIASHSDGSLRDALSLLDQVLSFFSDKNTPIDEKQVVEALGVSETNSITLFWSHVFNKNIPGMLQVIGENYLAGVDLKHFAERCLEELRLLYLVVLARETGKLTQEELDVSASHFTELKETAAKASLVQVERMAQILAKTISQLGWSSLPRFALEMTAVRMCHLDVLSKIETAFVEPKPLTPISNPEPVKNSYSAPKKPVISVAPPPPPPQAMPEYLSSPMSDTPAFEPEEGESDWKRFVDFVIKKRPLLGALLSHANFKVEEKGKNREIQIAFAEGSFYARSAMETKNAQDIGDLVKTFFGPDTAVQFSNAVKTTNQSLEKEKDEKVSAIKKTALEHPAVAQMKEMLGAEVIDVQVEL